MNKDTLEKLVQASFGGIDVEAAIDTLEEQKLELVYSDESVNALNDAANVLFDKLAKMKADEKPKAQRQVVKQQIDALVNARAFLYRIREARPGDVGVTPAPVGSAE